MSDNYYKGSGGGGGRARGGDRDRDRDRGRGGGRDRDRDDGRQRGGRGQGTGYDTPDYERHYERCDYDRRGYDRTDQMSRPGFSGQSSGHSGGYSGGHRGGHSGGHSGGQWRGDRGGGDERRSYSSGSSQRGYNRGSDQNKFQRTDDRRSGPSGDASTISLDVTKIAERVDILPEHQNKKKGKEGKDVELITNHYPIIVVENKELDVIHYDIDIIFKRRDGKESKGTPEKKNLRVEKLNENRQIIDKMMAENPTIFRKDLVYAFDGNKNLYTLEALNIGEETVTREVIITLDGYPEQTYEVKIKFARNVPMTELNNSEDFEVVRQVMDIVLRDRPQRKLVGIGRNLFDPNNVKPLTDDNCSIAFGHHQSILKTESGLTANIDRVTTTLRTQNIDEPLIDFIKRELNGSDIENLNTREVFNLTTKLRDLKIYSKHCGKRKAVIDCMADKTPDQHNFLTDDKDENSRVTLRQYFKDKYNIDLKYKRMPLIKIRGGTRDNPKYLPAEICWVYPNQPMPKSLISTEIQKQIVESTNTQTPPKRFELIQNSLQTIVNESQSLMDAFGLEIIPKPIKLTGRQLSQPKVLGDSRRLHKTVPLENGVFLNLSPRVNHEGLKGCFNTFFNGDRFGLIKTAQGMGFKITTPRIVGQNENIQSTRAQIEAFKNVMKNLKKESPVQIVFVCIPPKPTILYEYIKYISEIKYGIMTQCIQENLFMRTKPGYFNNFLLKTNAKLNGQNQCLEDQYFRPQLLTDPNSKTMVVGADVTHPGIHNPLANERVISSIAAVVGSYDRDFTKFIANVSAQGQNTEFIHDFGIMFMNILRGFNHYNKRYPENIVLFRDGVSDSQLDSVLTGEIPQIERAFNELKLKAPKITVYVVQKRHHTRIFLSHPMSDRNGRPLHNMPSGTVVDHTITNPDLNEFHICSHTGRLGTSRHAKYVVLRNDHRLSPDNLQLLAFSMCFTYCRCLSPISIPIPVKYADLAAYRAKLHVAAQNTEHEYDNYFESGGRRETDQEKRDREARNIKKLNETMVVHRDIKVLPYYC